MQWGKGGLFNKFCWIMWKSTQEKKKFLILPHLIHKNNFKCIVDLNGKGKTIKIFLIKCRVPWSRQRFLKQDTKGTNRREKNNSQIALK